MKALLALAVATALVLTGCGDDGEEATTGSSPVSVPQKTTTATTAPKDQKDSGQRGGSKQNQDSSSQDKGTRNDSTPPPSGPPPTTSASLPNEGTKRPAPGVPTNKGGDNSVQTYGTESSAADRAEAATALQAYLDARAAGDWEGACSYLAGGTRELLEKLAERSPKLEGQGCAGAMAAFAEGVPPSALAVEARIEVISFRVEGDRGFLIYKIPGNAVAAIPMAQENGAWQVGGMGATPLV